MTYRKFHFGNMIEKIFKSWKILEMTLSYLNVSVLISQQTVQKVAIDYLTLRIK